MSFKNKNYSLKNSLNLLSEFYSNYNIPKLSLNSNLSDVHLKYVDDFLSKSIEGLEDINIIVENNSKYKDLDFKEVLLICFLLEDLKDSVVNETFKLNRSIKKEFSFLFESIDKKELTIENFSNFLRSLAYSTFNKKNKNSVQLSNLKNGWDSEKKIFTCKYFVMTREDSVSNNIKIKLSQEFEKIIYESAFVKRFAGFYFEDILLKKYSQSQEFNESIIKQKIAYLVTLLLGYKSSYRSMKFSTLFNKMLGSNFNSIEYSNLINEHSRNVQGLPEKEKLARIIFNTNEIKIIDANSIQHNCGFDFLLIGPDNKASIIDLKTHHKNSESNFKLKNISTSSMHFLNSIMKITNINKEYSGLKFNSIGLFKISFEILNKIIKIDKFEIRTDTVKNFKNNINVYEKSTLALSDYCENIDAKSEDVRTIDQNYSLINIEEIYIKMFEESIEKFNEFFRFDNDYNIIIPDKIILQSKNQKERFIDVVKSIVSSSTIKNYPVTYVFKDENKIKILEKFVVDGKNSITYNVDSDYNTKQAREKKRYFYNSTLVLTILNNLSLNNISNPKFQNILNLANQIKIAANTEKNAMLTNAQSKKFKLDLDSIINSNRI